MVATKTLGAIDLQDVYKEFLGDESGEIGIDERAARRDTRRDRRESSRKISSFDEREALIRRRVRAEVARNRRQERNVQRANVEVSREIEAHEGWFQEQSENGHRTFRDKYDRGDFPRWHRRKL